MKKLLLPVIVIAAVVLFQQLNEHHESSPAEHHAAQQSGIASDTNAFDIRADGDEVEGQGIVTRIFADDNDGSRHQRFIVRLDSGQTILVAHNIDLAPRVSPLNEGDVISFRGEYEWNEKGGVVHWTHHDPDGQHPAGWIRRNGKEFQ